MPLLCSFNANIVTTNILIVQVFYRNFGFPKFRHFHKSKTLGATGGFVQHQITILYGAKFFKENF